jgi:hypothetical protein
MSIVRLEIYRQLVSKKPLVNVGSKISFSFEDLRFAGAYIEVETRTIEMSRYLPHA